MTVKVVPAADGTFIVLDTTTKRVIGRHYDKRAAIRQRRYHRRRKWRRQH